MTTVLITADDATPAAASPTAVSDAIGSYVSSANAGSATKLATARAINGVDFDGTAPITVAAAAGTLTGSTLTSGISLLIPTTQASDTTASGLLETQTAGENVTFGQVGYMKSDGKIWKGDATDDTKSPCLYMATASITANNAGVWLRLGVARNDAWAWTIGAPLYLDTTAGGMTHTPPSTTGNIVQRLGVAGPNADTVQFHPSVDTLTIA